MSYTQDSPEHYFKMLANIELIVNKISDTNYNKLNEFYNKLSDLRSKLIKILKEYEINPDLPKHNVPLYEEYKDLYLTYYFTNISLLLGICLFIRYIIYYINI